jgi:hypothetical protein
MSGTKHSRNRAAARRTLRRGLPWLAVLASTVACGTEIYRWTDERGQVHFSDRPGATNAAPMEMRTSPAAPSNEADRQARTERLLNEYALERQERAEAKRTADAALADRRQHCSDARKRLADLENSAYLYDRALDGTKIVLPESEFRTAKDQARTRVAALCKGDALPPPKTGADNATR